MSQTSSLFRLQQTDSQIDRIRIRLKDIAGILGNSESVNQAKKKAASSKQLLAGAESALRNAEAHMHDQRTKIEQTEANLYSGAVKNPKELQDLENESAALKRHLNVLEDKLLSAMIAVEQAEADSELTQQELQAATARVSAEHQSLHEEEACLQKKLAKLEAEKQAIISTIPGDSIAMYDELRDSRRGIAVAGVTDNACDACGAILTPAVSQAVRSLQEVTHCPTCGRILYVTEATEP